MDRISGRRNSFGKSAVEKAIDRIDRVTADLERDVIAFANELAEIEGWLAERVDDPIVSAIIRARFICGETWEKTSWLCFRSTNKSTSQMAYRRYIQEHNIFEE